MSKVAIIIVNWNGWQDTIECLKSLEEVGYDNFEVIVVDNGSTDNSVEKLEEFINYSSFKFQVSSFKFQENLGFAGANNYAMERLGVIARKRSPEPKRQAHGSGRSDRSNLAGAKRPAVGSNGIAASPLDELGAPRNDNDYILLLNNDTIVSPNFLKELVDVAESDKKIGIAGPMIYFYKTQRDADINADLRKNNYINSAGSKLNWLMNKGEYIGYNEKDRGQFGKEPYEVDYISGACLLIKKEVIEKIGGMPEDYFLYYEDTDWNFQAKKAGYKPVLAPAAKIWHKESASTKKIGAKYVYYHVRNGILFNKRCAPFYKKIIIHFYNLYVFIKQLIKIFIPSKREWARAVMRGMFDYYRGRVGKI